MKNVWGGAIMAMAVCAHSSLAHAQVWDQYGLRNILGMTVVVGEIDEDLKLRGINPSSIKTDIELRLRQNGIALRDSSSLWLTASITSVPIGENTSWSVMVQLEFSQFVLTSRDAGKSAVAMFDRKGSFDKLFQDMNERNVDAVTWSKAAVLTLGVNKLQSIRDEIKDMTDAFINDYLAVNPQQKK